MNATGGPDRLTSSLSIFLPLLQQPRTIEEICRSTHRSYNSIWKSLKQLQAEGIINKIDITDSSGPKFAYVSLYIRSDL